MDLHRVSAVITEALSFYHRFFNFIQVLGFLPTASSMLWTLCTLGATKVNQSLTSQESQIPATPERGQEVQEKYKVYWTNPKHSETLLAGDSQSAGWGGGGGS